jgi:serine/threonine protein kinase
VATLHDHGVVHRDIKSKLSLVLFLSVYVYRILEEVLMRLLWKRSL